MRNIGALFGICLVCAQISAARPLLAAEDSDAITLMRSFTFACVVNRGEAAGVRAYAKENGFTEMGVEGPFKSLMVDGGTGSMWDMPRPNNKIIALTVQDKPEVCTVWIESVDVKEMQDLFRRLRDSMENRGVEAIIAKDDPLKTNTGVGRLMMMTTYSMGNGEFLYTLAVADQMGSLAPGTPFQAALEIRAKR